VKGGVLRKIPANNNLLVKKFSLIEENLTFTPKQVNASQE